MQNADLSGLRWTRLQRLQRIELRAPVREKISTDVSIEDQHNEIWGKIQRNVAEEEA